MVHVNADTPNWLVVGYALTCTSAENSMAAWQIWCLHMCVCVCVCVCVFVISYVHMPMFLPLLLQPLATVAG